MHEIQFKLRSDVSSELFWPVIVSGPSSVSSLRPLRAPCWCALPYCPSAKSSLWRHLPPSGYQPHVPSRSASVALKIELRDRNSTWPMTSPLRRSWVVFRASSFKVAPALFFFSSSAFIFWNSSESFVARKLVTQWSVRNAFTLMISHSTSALNLRTMPYITIHWSHVLLTCFEVSPKQSSASPLPRPFASSPPPTSPVSSSPALSWSLDPSQTPVEYHNNWNRK